MGDLRTVIAAAITAERGRANLSQADLAKRLGWSRSVITRIENGTRVIAVHELPAICRALSTTLPRLLLLADPVDRHDIGV